MARSRLDELYEKADAFFERVATVHPTELACASGCHDCCAPGLTVTAVEAAAIEAYLASQSERPALAHRADRCAALGVDGRCTIYAARPLVCRTHGVPIRLGAEAGRRSLPMLDVCPKNFEGVDLTTLEPRVILDQATLSTILGAVDAAAGAEGVASRERVSIADLVRGAAGKPT